MVKTYGSLAFGCYQNPNHYQTLPVQKENGANQSCQKTRQIASIPFANGTSAIEEEFCAGEIELGNAKAGPSSLWNGNGGFLWT